MATYGYARVSTDQQATTGYGLDAQQAAIRQRCDQSHWTLDDIYVDSGVSSSKRRPQLEQAMAALERGDRLVVAKLDRLCRSTVEFYETVERARREGWELVMLQPNVDMSDPIGKFTAGILAQVAEFERELIRQRTREGLRAAAARGNFDVVDDSLRALIGTWRDEGASYRLIAATLTDMGVPTARGGARWSPSTIQSVLARR
jgi:DNA invertase Pin-like site-specific DNA recombinase